MELWQPGYPAVQRQQAAPGDLGALAEGGEKKKGGELNLFTGRWQLALTHSLVQRSTSSFINKRVLPKKGRGSS